MAKRTLLPIDGSEERVVPLVAALARDGGATVPLRADAPPSGASVLVLHESAGVRASDCGSVLSRTRRFGSPRIGFTFHRRSRAVS
jgi:hypothetical protein